jgi:SAM-dependent methyltransferase
MRRLIKELVQLCASNLPLFEPIYEFGAFQVSGQEGFADLRPIFPGQTYIGADIRPGPGVDVILDLHDIDLPAESVGTVLILDTIEHVEFPRKSIHNAHKILKPNGALIMTSVMNFPIHDYPHDYWRFTPEGFRSLMAPFTFSFVDSLGIQEFPHTVLGIAFKGNKEQDHMAGFIKEYEIWKRAWSPRTQPLWKTLVKPLIPPICLSIWAQLRKTSAAITEK